jgi:hypothetical protein
MPVTLSVDSMTVIHVSSSGISPCFPDTCKVPSPSGTTPTPLPNIAMSTDTSSETKQVQADGNGVCVIDSNFSTSSGDEAGVAGGVASNKTKGKAEFANCSFDVLFENKPVVRALDLAIHNDKNTPPFPVVQPPL